MTMVPVRAPNLSGVFRVREAGRSAPLSATFVCPLPPQPPPPPLSGIGRRPPPSAAVHRPPRTPAARVDDLSRSRRPHGAVKASRGGVGGGGGTQIYL